RHHPHSLAATGAAQNFNFENPLEQRSQVESGGPPERRGIRSLRMKEGCPWMGNFHGLNGRWKPEHLFEWDAIVHLGGLRKFIGAVLVTSAHAGQWPLRGP